MPRKAAAKKAPAKKAAAKKTTKRAARAQTVEQPTTPAPSDALVTSDNFFEMLGRWNALTERIAQECKPLEEEELVLRKALFGHVFPEPREGTNRVDLNGGWQLEGQYKLDRKIDEAALPAVFEAMPEGSKDYLVTYRPSLVLQMYRTLPENLLQIFDQCLTTKASTPTLKLVPPKVDAK